MTSPSHRDPWPPNPYNQNIQPTPYAPPPRRTSKTPIVIGAVLLASFCVLGAIAAALNPSTPGTQNAAGPQNADKAVAAASPSPMASPQQLPVPAEASKSPAPKPSVKPSTKPPTKPATKAPTKPSPKPTRKCDPNYAGACVPIASDVDCGGGSGNGPAYFYGVATVVGTDVYDLDRDNDGVACEKG